jgi:hypothetical protein
MPRGHDRQITSSTDDRYFHRVCVGLVTLVDGCVTGQRKVNSRTAIAIMLTNALAALWTSPDIAQGDQRSPRSNVTDLGTSQRCLNMLHSTRPHSLALAVAVAACIFLVDTLSTLQFAVASLYVLAVLIGAHDLHRRGIVLTGLFCSLLTALSYTLTHGFALDGAAPLRSSVSLVAIIITVVLNVSGILLAHGAGRLISTETALAITRSTAASRSRLECGRTKHQGLFIDEPRFINQHFRFAL